jgi:peptidoglycan/LPS O-acetylase OafA/YrhL
LGDASYTILLTHLLSISVLFKLAKSLAIPKHISYLSIDIIIVLLTLSACYFIYLWVTAVCVRPSYGTPTGVSSRCL